MTYPGYPPQPQPQYPGYPPQAPAYPPQAQAPYYPPQAPQGYAPPPPAQPLARGSIDDFYDQPAASGKSITFDKKPVGTSYAGVVARTLTNADIQQQTEMLTRRPLFYPDGKPKLVMIVPLQMQPSQEFPDGRAAWYVKGSERAELERAMEAAGCKPGTPPEMGAVITITYTGDRPIPNLNPQKVKAITYQRPVGANGHAAGTAQPAMAAQSAEVQQPQYAVQPPAPPQYQQMVDGAYASAGLQAPAPPAPQFQPPQYAPLPPPDVSAYQPAPPPPAYQPQPAEAPQPPAAVVPQPAQAGQAGPVAQLSPEQQALLARLTGGQG